MPLAVPGIEYNQGEEGRCRVWTRPEGVEGTVPLTNYAPVQNQTCACMRSVAWTQENGTSHNCLHCCRLVSFSRSSGSCMNGAYYGASSLLEPRIFFVPHFVPQMCRQFQLASRNTKRLIRGPSSYQGSQELLHFYGALLGLDLGHNPAGKEGQLQLLCTAGTYRASVNAGHLRLHLMLPYHQMEAAGFFAPPHTDTKTRHAA